MRISHKEKLLLGYDPNPSPNPSRSSDIDFSDVFGGPPRRASLQESQNRHPDEDDDDTWRGDGDWNDETLPGRSSWSNHTGEKPVFGSEIVSRRRYQSQDFFDDIFRGDQSQSSSPRMGGRDPLSSAPGSRALSPARPLPSGAVPLGSPAQFSLPARLANSHSLSNLSRLSGQGHDAFQGGEAFSPNLRGSLSHKASRDGNLDGTGGGTQATNGGNQFHFSMHKWASKGVPLVMSLGKRNSWRSKIMLERSLSLNGSVEDESDKLVGEIQPAGVNTDNVLSFKVHVASAAKESKELDQIVNKSVTNVPQLRPNSEVHDENSPVGVASYYAEESRYDLKQSSMKLHGVEGRSGYDSAISEFRANKRVAENKWAASSDVDRKECNEEVAKSKLKEQSGLKGDNKRNNIKKNLGNDTAKEKVNKSIGNDREKVKGETGKNGAKGKVKEFIKIFNQEPSSKPSADIERTPSGRWKNTDVSRANSKSTFSSPKTEGKIQGFNMNYSLDSSPKVDENRTLSSGKQFEANSVQEPSYISSTETDNLGSTMGSVSDGFEASNANIDVAFDSIQIEELQQIQDKTSENSENTEDMQPYQSKILKWSKGREGNIRALLSTLQCVLWPNSGWKPVPLVDIIEANAVKKSYQRALLYLHPDKLQQKGASSHQKFIAQKVFDILQEAWDHFNTLGSLGTGRGFKSLNDF